MKSNNREKIPTQQSSAVITASSYTDRWGTIVLLNVMDKVILVRASGNVSRGWR